MGSERPEWERSLRRLVAEAETRAVYDDAGDDAKVVRQAMQGRTTKVRYPPQEKRELYDRVSRVLSQRAVSVFKDEGVPPKLSDYSARHLAGLVADELTDDIQKHDSEPFHAAPICPSCGSEGLARLRGTRRLLYCTSCESWRGSITDD